MAQNRRSQRGVIRAATTALLAGLSALLSVACSTDVGSGGGENLGKVSQALACGKLNPCPPSNDCATIKCNLITSTCEYTPLVPDGTQCKDPLGNLGACTSIPAQQPPICCTGCIERFPGGYACRPGGEVPFCGLDGAECLDCTTNSCFKDSCEKGLCVNSPVGDKNPCLDNTGTCWQDKCCTGCLDAKDVCQPGNAVGACGKSSADGLVACNDCTDAEACTNDVCDSRGNCANPAVPDNTLCVDGTKCNGDEACKTGKCTSPANFTCDDNNVCTSESCDPVTGCAHTKLTGTSCADANKCNGAETCVTGSCSPGTALNCNDNNACTTDSCLPGTGCSNAKLNGTSCADANKCNGTEMCVTGVCTAGTAPNCDDNNPCTDDSCDPVGGCLHTAVSPGTKCDDGNVCNGISTCSGTVCSAGTALSCDDGNVCTDDSCVPLTGCKFVNNLADCSDNNLCTQDDKCSAGACKGGAAPNCDDNEACTNDTCDSGKGCLHAAVGDGADCDDGNDCSTGDKCVTGKCKASGGKVCDDLEDCTQNACDPANGSVCTFPNETSGTPCTFDKCHQNSTCQTGACSQGDPIDCDDANPCTTDSCDPLVGCKHVADNLATCSDGDLCTSADKCKSGVCVGTDVACAPLDECHEPGTCSASTGVCDDPRSQDDKPCTGGHCVTGKCVLNPIGAGGAGGETGVGGEATAGGSSQGGEPPVVSVGGEGNEPGVGGEPTTGGGTTGTGGKSSGGSTVNDGGAPEIPEHVFVRSPGGCSCSTPGSQPANDLAWLGGIALAGALARRRRRRSGSSSSEVPSCR